MCVHVNVGFGFSVWSASQNLGGSRPRLEQIREDRFLEMEKQTLGVASGSLTQQTQEGGLLDFSSNQSSKGAKRVVFL